MGKRWYTEKEAMTYTGLGRSTIRRIAKETDGARHIGKRVLYDVHALDAYIDGAPHESTFKPKMVETMEERRAAQ